MSQIILKHPLVWNGLISRTLLKNNNILFKKDIYCREDLVFNVDLAKLDFRGVYTFSPTYIYRYATTNSLSNSVHKRSIISCVPIIKSLIRSREQIEDIYIKEYIESELIGTVNSFFKCILRLNWQERNFLLKTYGKEIEQHKIPSNNLTIFAQLYRLSPRCYSFMANIIDLILPAKYKICK